MVTILPLLSRGAKARRATPPWLHNAQTWTWVQEPPVGRPCLRGVRDLSAKSRLTRRASVAPAGEAVSHRVPTNNKKGGKKGSKARNTTEKTKRDLPLREDGQCYAKVTKVLGDGRFVCAGFDGTERLGVLRGRMRRRAWVRAGEIVLVALRAFQDSKSDIIDIYTSEEVRRLVHADELPASAQPDHETDPDDEWIGFGSDSEPE